MRVVFDELGARAGRRGQRSDGQPAVGVRGMAEQQPQDLAAGIPAGTGYGDGCHAVILHVYALCCKFIPTAGAEIDEMS